MRTSDGQVIAHNTDMPALADELRRLAPGVRLADGWMVARTLVLGTGATARSAIVALACELSVAQIVVRGRMFDDEDAMDRFHAEMGELLSASGGGTTLRLEPWRGSPATERTVSAVVQATSAGMAGADPGEAVVEAVDWAALPTSAVALDAVYAPPSTPFLRAAALHRIKANNGLGMLARQGALAFELWLGMPAPFDVMLAALAEPTRRRPRRRARASSSTVRHLPVAYRDRVSSWCPSVTRTDAAVRNVPPNELLPILVTELEDAESRELLLAVAEARGEAYVPLNGAPVDTRAHLLEVHTAGTEPLLLLAMPVGAPTENGFLLRLARYNPNENVTQRFAPREGRDKHTTGDPLKLRPRTTTGLHHLTAGHAAALSADPQPETNHVGRLIGGKLRIEQVVGAGGMGVVYRATHLGLRMPVAVKVLKTNLQQDLEFCRRFQEEALAASRLDHPNLTRVLDFGQEPDGLVYIAMEFLDGTDLGTLIDRDGRLPLPRIVDIMSQVCAGLMHMHSRGMVHSDLKPDNLILVAGHDEDGQPIEAAKLCDFGIAVTRGVAATEVLGTPRTCRPSSAWARTWTRGATSTPAA